MDGAQKVTGTAAEALTTVMTVAHTTRQQRIDWGREARLGAVLSLFAALVALALHGWVDDRAIVVGVIVVTSLISWSRPLTTPRSPAGSAEVRDR